MWYRGKHHYPKSDFYIVRNHVWSRDKVVTSDRSFHFIQWFENDINQQKTSFI
jgi:hypothetical protein